MKGNFDAVSGLNLGLLSPSIFTVDFNKFCYFYNLHNLVYFHSKAHVYILRGKCKVNFGFLRGFDCRTPQNIS